MTREYDMTSKAFLFASEAHRDHLYGGEPYPSAHLAKVVAIVEDFGFDGPYIEAAWLHDVVEDCPVPIARIEELFGNNVAAMVHAVSGEGETREERNKAIYRKIGEHPPAAIVKLADRIANVEAATPDSRHMATYRRENGGFGAAIRPHVPQAMWARLERALALRDI